MTQMGLDYLRHQEQRRSNLANEVETNRSNLAREGETYRHNVATETQAANELVEQNRHNVRTETLEDIKNQAQKEHYERQDAAQKEHYERQDAETNRANLAKEFETNRANEAKELQNALNAFDGNNEFAYRNYINKYYAQLKKAGVSDAEIKKAKTLNDLNYTLGRIVDTGYRIVGGVRIPQK